MASLFDDNELEQLKEMAKVREAELKKERLQNCSDMLYKYLAEHVKTNRDVILCCLKRNIKNAESRKNFEVPIWTYAASTFTERVSQYNRRIQALQALGQDDTIHSSDGKYERRVADVILKTDILARLSLLFGKDFIVVNRWQSFGRDNGIYRRFLGCIALQYHPNGDLQKNNPPAFSEKQDAEKKYQNVDLRQEKPFLRTGRKKLDEYYTELYQRIANGDED